MKSPKKVYTIYDSYDWTTGKYGTCIVCKKKAVIGSLSPYNKEDFICYKCDGTGCDI